MEERLQKWIARCGISSRRAAEELLRQGRLCKEEIDRLNSQEPSD